jgi:hypothetical protein
MISHDFSNGRNVIRMVVAKSSPQGGNLSKTHASSMMDFSSLGADDLLPFEIELVNGSKVATIGGAMSYPLKLGLTRLRRRRPAVTRSKQLLDSTVFGVAAILWVRRTSIRLSHKSITRTERAAPGDPGGGPPGDLRAGLKKKLSDFSEL